MNFFKYLGALLLGATCALHAQTYPDPSRPIKLIVPFGAGSGSDLVARAYARAMAESSNLKVFIENKAGADGVIAMQAAKIAAPDGYTLMLTNSSTQVLNVHMLAKIPYDPVADFIPISGVAKFSLVLNAGSSTKFKSARELIDAAKAAPGKYSFGHATASTRLAVEMLEHVGGVKMLSVPYKTMSAATLALASGEVDIVMNDASTAIPFYKSGQVRPLGATGPTRMTALPDVPTMREQGLADYDFGGWYAMYFPAGTAPGAVSAMQAILLAAAKSPHVKEALTLNAFEPLALTGPQLTALQRQESEKWGNLVRVMGLQAR